MFIKYNVVLYYSLLVAQEHIIDSSSKFQVPRFSGYVAIEPRPWYEHKLLITDDNVFDINDLQILILKDNDKKNQEDYQPNKKD